MDAFDRDYELDRRAVRRAFSRAAGSYEAAAALADEIRRRLIERLEILKDAPTRILDLGAGTGRGSRELKTRYPRAQVIALDSAWSMLREARRHRRWWRPFARLCADAQALPLANGCIDWCVSNLLLPWCEPLDTLLMEVKRVLAPGGLFSFTSFGPDTLQELRAAWSRVDHGPHVHRFIDMHHVGDALIQAGFAEPVLDVERIVLTYESADRLFRELKAMGFVTLTRGRPRHLAARRALRALVNTYRPQEGRIHATFEVVFGQAWRPRNAAVRPRRGEFAIPTTAIGRRRLE